VTSEHAISIVYLAISLVSLCIHGWAVWSLWRAKAQKVLTRTTACRVVCSLLYIGVGVNALTRSWAVTNVSLTIFGLTQAIWDLNSWLDKRLGVPRKQRRRWPITITIGREPAPDTTGTEAP
jgi:hypothetical protein